MRRSFLARFLLAAAIPLCLVLTSGAGLYSTFRQSITTSDQMTEQQAVVIAAREMMLSMMKAEADRHAFYTTGNESLLSSHGRALSDFTLSHDRLASMLTQAPEQHRQLQEARSLFQRWNREVARPSIEQRQGGGHGDGKDYLQQAQRLTDRFRSTMKALIRNANMQLANHRLERLTLSHNGNLIALLGFGGATAVALLLWLLLASRTSTSFTRLRQAARHVREGDLDYRAPVHGRDELAMVTRAFNQLAERAASEQQARLALSSQVDGMVSRRTRELLAMHDMIELLQSCQSFDEAVQVARTMLPELLPQSTGALLIHQGEQAGVLSTITQWGPQRNRTPQDYQDEDCWALRRGRSHQTEIEDPEQPLSSRHIHPVSGNHLCIPLIAQGRSLGVLHVGLQDPSDEEWENRRQYAMSLAEQLSLSLANLELRETLQQQSVRDPLTGLYNRRYLEETIERELRRSGRENRPLSVIMLDLDDFKAINDEYGHTDGDQVLIRTAHLLRENMRGEDLVCRFGGEEFTIILPGADTAAAGKRAESLRQAITELEMEIDDRNSIRLSASFGIACFPVHAGNMLDLIDGADDALYRAKRQGRNRVVIADNPRTTE